MIFLITIDLLSEKINKPVFFIEIPINLFKDKLGIIIKRAGIGIIAGDI